MTPEPHVLPDLSQPVEGESQKRRLEVEHDMLWTRGIVFGGEATEEVATRLQRGRESVDRLDGIGQVLEYIHRGDEIECLVGELFADQVDGRGGHLPSSEPPSAEVEQCRADIRLRDIIAVAGEEDGAGPDASAEIEIASAGTAPSEIDRQHIGERRYIVLWCMRPHQIRTIALARLVEPFSGIAVPRVGDRSLPIAFEFVGHAATARF